MHTNLKKLLLGIICSYTLTNIHIINPSLLKENKKQTKNTNENTLHTKHSNVPLPLIYVSSCNQLLLYNEQSQVKELIQNANKGNIQAMLTLGKLYSKGITKDNDKSIYWYEKAAQLGNSDALVELGIIHEHPYDPFATKKAIKYYEKAVNLNNGYAMTRLAMIYGTGYVTVEGKYKEDTQLAMKLLKQGAATLDSRSLYMLAQQYEVNYLFAETIDIPKALYYYEQIIAHDKTFSKEKINAYGDAAYIYIYNKAEVKQNIPKGIEYLKIAAEQNSISAVTTLAEIYEEGRLKSLDQIYGKQELVAVDYSQAFYYYHKAAIIQDQSSMYKTALYYQNGKAVEKDFAKALEWYKKLAELDDKRGFYGLGVCYQYGYGVKKNNLIALQYYEKASEIKEEKHICLTGVKKQEIYPEQLQAMYAIGELYYHGADTVEKNQFLAQEWLNKAAKLGHFPSKFLLFRLNK